MSESLYHAAVNQKIKLQLQLLDAEDYINEEKHLESCHGILIPGGFGKRGLEGKIRYAMLARTKKIPFFGICFGFQAAVIDFARNIAKIPNANSGEVGLNDIEPVIDLMEQQKKYSQLGGTMRLGAFKTTLLPNTKIKKIYGKETIMERHRHRYEFNNKYRTQLQKKGLVIGSIFQELDLVESIELKEHPWYVAVQYHPEFLSTPIKPHPLFTSFIKHALKYKKG